MAVEQQKYIESLAQKVHDLISAYEKLKQKNDALQEQNTDLAIRLKRKEEHYNELHSKHNNLIAAKVLELSAKDKKEAKKRISGLVREIDKCISLLNI